jgi:hypothetical protein
VPDAYLKAASEGHVVYDNKILPRAARELHASQVRLLFAPNPDFTADYDYFDKLPPISRAWIRNCLVVVNAANWQACLNQVRNESALIELVEAVLPLHMAAVCGRKWGQKHPQLETRDFSLVAHPRGPSLRMTTAARKRGPQYDIQTRRARGRA